MPLEFPLAVNQPEIAERVIRALDLKGDQPSMVDGYFQLSIDALKLTDPEFLFLRRGTLAAAGASPPTGAATFSGVCFGPIGTTRNSSMAVVRKVRIYNFNAAAQNFNYQVTAGVAAPGANVAPTVRDSRLLSRPGGAFATRWGLFTANPAASIIAVPTLIGLPAGGSVEIGPFILTDQGDYTNQPVLAIEAAGANVGFHVYCEWEERPTMASELRTTT